MGAGAGVGRDIEVVPATVDRFDDLAAVLGPNRPDASVCWCLSHRLDAKTDREPVGPERGEYVRSLCGRDQGPGVLAYDDGEVAGWAVMTDAADAVRSRASLAT